MADRQTTARTSGALVLDRPEVRWALFHPRQKEALGLDTLGIEPVTVEVEPGVSLGGCLCPAGPEAPVILYFHDNGEIATDCDDIAPMHTQLGLTLPLIDCRAMA